jgi:micrococcal nuclease
VHGARRAAAGALALTLIVATSITTIITTAGLAGAGQRSRTARLDHVVDGDTIALRNGERVRLIGVDTPEVDPEIGVECFGRRASEFVEDLLDEGDRVRLVFDVERRDQYDRLLAYVYRASDDLFVNAELLEGGYAQVLTVPPNVEHADEFRDLAREAREDGRGLWSACDG